MGKFNKVEYNNQFIASAYDRINLTVPKGNKEKIRARAESKGMSVNAYINDLIEKDNQSDPK
jgi:predicted DNA binding CopG/RHH family protein